MNNQANITSGFQDTTLARVLSKAVLSPKIDGGLGDKTLAGEMWRKYDAQADTSRFQDTTLAKVLSEAVSSPEIKRNGQAAAAGDKTQLWRKYNEQADMTHFGDSTLGQILAKVVVSPENKSSEECRKGKKRMMGDKTMLNNMWNDVNGEGEVTLMGRMGIERQTAAAASDFNPGPPMTDLPSPLQSQVTKNL